MAWVTLGIAGLFEVVWATCMKYSEGFTCLLYTSRLNGHIGTETRPRLLREAAVGNIAQWGKP